MAKETVVEKEKRDEFGKMIIMKEKRRISRSKGERTYTKDKLAKPKNKMKRTKNIQYDQNIEYDDFDFGDRV